MIRLLLVDDHVIVREGLIAILATNQRMKVVAEAGDGIEALARCREVMPDVVLLDVRMPSMDGFETLQQLKSAHPEPRVIMLAGSSMPKEIEQARRLGAAGFLSKDSEWQELCSAIVSVSEGKEFWPELAGDQLVSLPPLTARELQVLESARRGLSNGDIGRALSISEHTVKSHVKTLLKKLHAADRAEAVARGFEVGLLR